MPISRTIREQVTDRIRDEVVDGLLSPGSVLRETELANRFGVSRGPVRDAFLQLSNEGYLAYRPNRGVTVRRPPDQADRDFIAGLRRQIEIFVCEKGLADVSEESLAAVGSALSELEVACGGQSPAAVKRCDLAFHEAILLACGGDSLLPAWKQLCARMLMVYERLKGFDEVYKEHADMFGAFESHDLAALRERLNKNIT